MVSTGTTPPEEVIFGIFTKIAIRGWSYPEWTFRWRGWAPAHAGPTGTLGPTGPPHLKPSPGPWPPARSPRSRVPEQSDRLGLDEDEVVFFHQITRVKPSGAE